MHPCPCGYLTDPRKARSCNTTKNANYMGKISGPLLDRIDIHIEIPAVKYKELTDVKDAESSAAIKSRVEKARAIQGERFKMESSTIFYNAQMNTKLIKKHCVLEDEARELLKLAMTELGLSARAYDKILKAQGRLRIWQDQKIFWRNIFQRRCSIGSWIDVFFNTNFSQLSACDDKNSLIFFWLLADVLRNLL